MTRSSIWDHESFVNQFLTYLFRVLLKSVCRVTHEAKVSPRSDLFLRNERRINPSEVGRRLCIDWFWYFDNISERIEWLEVSDVYIDRELFSLHTDAVLVISYANGCYLEPTHDQILQNCTSSNSTYFESHTLASSATIHITSDAGRTWEMQHRASCWRSPSQCRVHFIWASRWYVWRLLFYRFQLFQIALPCQHLIRFT